MPASSITLSGLTLATPDGTPFLSDLDLVFGPERTGIVGRNGTGKSTLLRLLAGETRPVRGHVTTGGTCGLLRQDLPDATGARIADLFGAGAALDLLDRAEAGRAGAAELAEADWTLPARIGAALLRCGLDAAPATRLDSLSGGERMRAGLAALVFAAPDFLLLDEPTNSLDRAGRAAVIELLRGWRGGAIVVSHDRELLAEMDAIVELSTLGATRYGGNYAVYEAARARELAAARHDLAEAGKTRHEAARRARQAAERKARTDRAGRRKRARRDQPKILMDAAKERSEASGGANARLREDRQRQAEAALARARDRVETLDPLQMQIAPTGLAAGTRVLRAEGLTGGPDPAQPVIRDVSLTITGPERLAITGPNGAGKTTLLALLTGRMEPLRGTVTRGVAHAMLDQHLDLLAPDLSLHENVLRRASERDETRSRAALARFGFRADEGLRLASTLSGGERLRAALACTLGQASPPPLMVLDEPTNHLDLDAIEALEAGLLAHDGALLVVSHDARFLDRIGVTRRISLPIAPDP